MAKPLDGTLSDIRPPGEGRRGEQITSRDPLGKHPLQEKTRWGGEKATVWAEKPLSTTPAHNPVSPGSFFPLRRVVYGSIFLNPSSSSHLNTFRPLRFDHVVLEVPSNLGLYDL